MKDLKKRMEMLSFYDHTGIEAHLEKMAAGGWMLEKLGTWLWHYRRCEPKKVKFSVTYYPRASQFDPGPSVGELTFRDFCGRTGWRLAASSAQLQIFHNENPEALPIETDPVMEVDTIHRAAKRSFLPCYFILLVLAVLRAVMTVGRLLTDPIGLLSRPAGLFSAFAWAILFLVCAVELISYFRWRAKAKQAAERGEFLATPSTSKFQKVCMVLVLACLAWWLVNFILLGSSLTRFVGVAMLLAAAGMIALFLGLRSLMKRLGASKNLNRAVTFTVYFAGAFLLLGIVVFLGVRGANAGLLSADGRSGDPSLSVSDLLDVDMGGYRTRQNGDETFLLGRREVQQGPDWHRDDPDLSLPSLDYTVVKVNFPPLYGWCRDALYHERDDTWKHLRAAYVEIDPAPWGASEAWEMWDFEYGQSWNQYLLCYDGSIVFIDFDPDWAPTPEQMAIVGEKLGK